MLDSTPPGLSLPPENRSGWPWTEGSPPLPPTMPDRSPWPRISIVTPSYNQAQFLEETIRSVLLQGYPNLEYFVVDGGSSDGSVEIIRKYEPWITWWVSEKDRGQSHAINKGFARAGGKYVAWLNSDDVYLPGALASLAAAIHEQSSAVLVYGDCNFVETDRTLISTWQAKPADLRSLLDGNTIPQQATLIRKDALDAVGGMDESLNYVFDYVLWMQLAQRGPLLYTPGTVADFRMHDTSKSMTQGYRFYDELFAWWERTGLLAASLNDAEQDELMRRTQVTASLEALSGGNDERAVAYLRAAVAGGQWPFGSAEAMAQHMRRKTVLAMTKLEGSSWQEYQRVHRVLQQALPRPMAAQVWRRIVLHYHLIQLYANVDRANRRAVQYHLRHVVTLEPRLLLNRGMWSLGARSLLGSL